jgi:arginase
MYKKKIILPNPFHKGPYGSSDKSSFERIVKMSGSNDSAGSVNSSNLLMKNCMILEPVSFEDLPDSKPEIGIFLDTCESMTVNASLVIENIWHEVDQLLVFGGDHSISIGTGAGLSKVVDMSEVGLLYIDAHTDINIPSTSQSKSITGYPVAVNMGLGPDELIKHFNGNFIKKTAFIGIRDVDEKEVDIVNQLDTLVHSALDIEEIGIVKCLENSLTFLKDCKYIWLSIDIDSLEHIYFTAGETDEPAPGGLTPRELLYITDKVFRTGKLKVTELTQINDVGTNTPIIALASRISELALGLGTFRYGK